MNYAIIKSGIVENIVEWDGTSEYNVEGVLVEADENAWIGGVYADGAFVARPPEPEPEPTPEQIQAEADKASAISKLEALGLTDAEIKALSGGL